MVTLLGDRLGPMIFSLRRGICDDTYPLMTLDDAYMNLQDFVDNSHTY